MKVNVSHLKMYIWEKSNKCSVITHPPYMHRCKRLEDTFEEEKNNGKSQTFEFQILHVEKKMINIVKNKKSPPLQFTLQLHNMSEKSPLTFPSFRQFFSPRWLALALILRAQACHHHFSSIHQFLLEPPISSNSK